MGIHDIERLVRGLLMPGIALLTVVAGSAAANPDNAVVVAGDVTFSESADRLDVLQSSDKAIIDWRSFDIGHGEHTNFSQPSSSSIALNRVLGGDVSQIHGSLTANGRVFLINPGGVIFGSDATVAVGGLIATTADLPNDDFLSGDYAFAVPSGSANAAVVNRGRIEIDDGGAVVLAAPQVENTGLVRARLGQVELAGVNTFTVDFEGDGLLSFDVGAEVSQPDRGGAPRALVSNSGTIAADGGIVALTARAADAAVDRVINMDGLIEARAVEVRGGTIVLSGGEHGIVDVSGTMDVSGTASGQQGGDVRVLGDKVGLFAGADIDASGDGGGGSVLVGGNFQGKGPEQNAARAYVDADAGIRADALTHGDGGRVIVWADERTQFHGEISVRGGAEQGDGGFVEVSGRQNLDFAGAASVDAARGAPGTLLLDPTDIRIVQAAPATDDGDAADGVIAFGDPDNPVNSDPMIPFEGLIISAEQLASLTGNVVLQATRNIRMNGVTLLFTNQGEGESIVIQAGNDITLDTSILVTGQADLTLEADSPDAPGGSDSSGELAVLGSVVGTTGGDLTAIGASMGFDGGVLVSTTGNINVALTNNAPMNTAIMNNLQGASTEGVFTLGRATTVNGTELVSSGVTSFIDPSTGAPIPVTSNSRNTHIITSGDIGPVAIDATNGSVAGRSVTLRAGGNIDVQALTLDGGNFVVDADSPLLPGGGDGFGTLTLPAINTGGGSVSLRGIAEAVPPITTGGGSVDIVGGAFVASTITTSGGDVSLTGDLVNLQLPIDAGPGGNIVLTADTLIFPAAGTAPSLSAANGTLTIQPLTATRAIALQDVSSQLDRLEIDQATLDLSIAENFDVITFGRPDGMHDIVLSNVTFTDPVVIQTPNGGSINVAGELRGTDNASITLIGSGQTTTLNADIITAGQPITLRDSLVLGTDILLDTTDAGMAAAGADITLFGDVIAGNGNDLQIVGGTTGTLAARGFNAVNTLDVNAATANIVGDMNIGELLLTVSGDLVATGSMTITGNTQLSAGTISLAGPGNDFIGSVGLTTAGDATIVDANSLNIGASVIGGDFTVNTAGAIVNDTQIIVGGDSIFNAGAGAIQLTGQNDFLGSVSLNNSGANAVSIFDLTALTLTNSAVGSGQFRVVAGGLDIAGPVSGSGALLLEPISNDQSIGIGDAAADFTLSSADLGNLQNGFSSITIGRAGFPNQVTLENARFVDPLLVLANGPGAGITVNSSLTGLDNASITLTGPGRTVLLNGNIVTNGQPIVFNDSVVLLTDVLLDTTAGGAAAGGNITLNGPLDGANNTLTVRGGLWQNQPTAPFTLAGLVVVPTGAAGNGALVFGDVAGSSGRNAADEVTVVGRQLNGNFLINGCVMGVGCEQLTDKARFDLPVSNIRIVTLLQPPLGWDGLDPVYNIPDLTILPPTAAWDRPRTLGDPRDTRNSNLGNEELLLERRQ